MDTKTLNGLIGKMTKKQLMELIEVMVRFNSHAEQELLDYCRAHGFEDSQQLILEKQLENHWRSVYGLIEGSDTYGGCSEEDEAMVYDTIYMIMDLLKEGSLAWECRKKVLDEMLAFIGSDNSGFTDVLADCAVELCDTDIEQEYLADRLSVIGNNYYRGLATSFYRDLGRDEKYLKARKENLEYASDYLSLSDYYEERGRKEEALRWAWKGLEKCQGRLDELYQYLFKHYGGDEATLWKLYNRAKTKKRDVDAITELMYAHFKEKGDYLHQKDLLVELVRCCDSREVGKWYRTCKAELRPEDWSEHQTMLLDRVNEKNLSEYMKICLENNNKAEVLAYLEKQPAMNRWHHLDLNHCLSKELVNEYPDQIVALYLREMSVYIDQKNEKNYRHAVSVLKEIRQILRSHNKEAEWNKLYSKLLEEHKKKRLLLKIIDEKL
ncbi:MAG: hypothetical protein SCK57_14035 [Bacillota bacterium]|nr:hypothetical protein [Bacillota bacterium]MDW7678774.1 hypothetical protein [Bacillota bacterium]